MASLVAILDLKGKSLIQRSYRDDVSPSHIERFLPYILDLEEEGQQVTPCFSSQGVNFMHIRHSNLYREFLWLYECGVLIVVVQCLQCPRGILMRRRSSCFCTGLYR
jgi:hypothetical protein